MAVAALLLQEMAVPVVFMEVAVVAVPLETRQEPVTAETVDKAL